MLAGRIGFSCWFEWRGWLTFHGELLLNLLEVVGIFGVDWACGGLERHFDEGGRVSMSGKEACRPRMFQVSDFMTCMCYRNIAARDSALLRQSFVGLVSPLSLFWLRLRFASRISLQTSPFNGIERSCHVSQSES